MCIHLDRDVRTGQPASKGCFMSRARSRRARMIAPLAAAAVALLASACGSAASTTSTSATSSAGGGGGKVPLVLYAAEGYDSTVAAAFQKATGIPTSVYDAHTGIVVSKIEQEKNNPQ